MQFVLSGKHNLTLLSSLAGPESYMAIRQINRRKVYRFYMFTEDPLGKQRLQRVARPACLYTRLNKERQCRKEAKV